MTENNGQSGDGPRDARPDELELGLQPVTPDSGTAETHDEALQTLEAARTVDHSEMTLDEYMKQFEVDEGLEANKKLEAKLQKIEALLVYVAGKFPDLTPDEVAKKVLLRTYPGYQVGESYGDFVGLDPVTLNHYELHVARRGLVHELVHLTKGVKDEGVAEYWSTFMTGEEAKDYQDLVHNVGIVVEAVGRGDKEAGLNLVTERLVAKDYDGLFYLFAKAYCDVAENDDFDLSDKRYELKVEEAEKFFQLAFPRLITASDGSFEHDAESLMEH